MTRKLKYVLPVLLLIVTSEVATALDRPVFIFYYGWYGNPSIDGQWLHWGEYGHAPPKDLASSFFPKLGAYSSNDRNVIDQHMRWIAGANINVLIYSWWGHDDPTDHAARAVLDTAAEYNLRVAFLIEPYAERSIHSICEDIEYLTRTFGKHRAFFRMNYSNTAPGIGSFRPMFFIYDPDYSDSQLRRLSQLVHTAHPDTLLLLQSTDATLISQTGADGIFAYEAVLNILHFYKGIVEAVRSRRGIFIPCVSPGFNMKRTVADTPVPFRARRRGQNYDRWWEAVLASGAEFASVISFNEWHEGTQIEPAVRYRSYYSYNGAYNRKGDKAATSFLRRTARWIEIFQNR